MSELNDLLTTRELQRWRLILGEAAETTLCGLDDNARQIDHALEWLYGRDPERLQRGERYGGLGRSNLTTPEWINSIHTLFPQQVIERLESDAVLRYGIEDVVTNLDVLERMQPSESLLRAVLHTKHLMNPEVLAAARQIVRQVVEEIMDIYVTRFAGCEIGSPQRSCVFSNSWINRQPLLAVTAGYPNREYLREALRRDRKTK